MLFSLLSEQLLSHCLLLLLPLFVVFHCILLVKRNKVTSLGQEIKVSTLVWPFEGRGKQVQRGT